MKLFDKINELTLLAYEGEVDLPTHLLLSLDQLRELKHDYNDLFGEDQPEFTIHDIEETLGMTICVTAAEKMKDHIEFLKKVRTNY